MKEIKQQMTEYWTQRAESFRELRMRELRSEKSGRWLREIGKHLPEGKLKILDIGTGTGYFAFLLAAQGHSVTGIDLTEEMITQAKYSASVLNLKADFFAMDAEALDLEEGSFDALVTRNLTWCLPNLAKAYAGWYKVLKPGGVLINFDADYCREAPVTDLPENHAHKGLPQSMNDAYAEMKDTLRPTQRPRPQWDVELLKTIGFQKVQLDTDIWQRMYAERDEFYNPTSIFAIAATK